MTMSIRTPHLMSDPQEFIAPQAAADWALADQAVRALRIGPGPRALRVEAGCLWLTANGRPGRPAADHVLQAGDSLWLPAGIEVLIEAWGAARFSLRVPPAACTAERGKALVTAHWRRAWARGWARGLAAA